MEELAKVALDNEMDLILAHKRTMKLAELAGLSLATQTSFATAVSEVGRYALEAGSTPQLTLCASVSRKGQYLVARIEDGQLVVPNPLSQGMLNARRLVEKLEITNSGTGSLICLYCPLPASRTITPEHFERWRAQFYADRPLSAYDEIKKKNEQLQNLADRLQDSEQHYKRVTDSLPLVIFTANQMGQLLYANAWLKELTGYSLPMLNQTKWAKVIHPDDYADFWKQWNRQTAERLSFQYECRIREAVTGAYQWHLFTAKPIPGDFGSVAAWTGFVVNIHAQKIVGQTLRENEELAQAKASLEKSQTELEKTVRELNRSNEYLQQFAYVASHDLQEPLRKIVSFGTMLNDQFSPDLNPTGRDFLERMLGASRRMSLLIKELLAYSRLTTQRVPFREVPLLDLTAEVLDDLALLVEESQAQVFVSELPVVPGDPTQLRQLFQNLLSNALKFRRLEAVEPPVQPVVRVETHWVNPDELPVQLANRADRRFCRIDVIDNGIGFDAQYSDQIFQMFQRLNPKNHYSGSGVGLAIARKVAENHEGLILTSSQAGAGSTFSVYLPTE
ncbi:ATP-binding protein [Rudanella paleaurantiibacter]|nr:ATP-binding protein [Rudanella paleaurantiibacter]